jgi:hypothetical protein
VHVFFALWTVSFTFLPLRAAAAAWAGFLVPYYTLSALGDFPHTGARSLAALRPARLQRPGAAAGAGGGRLDRD